MLNINEQKLVTQIMTQVAQTKQRVPWIKKWTSPELYLTDYKWAMAASFIIGIVISQFIGIDPVTTDTDILTSFM